MKEEFDTVTINNKSFVKRKDLSQRVFKINEGRTSNSVYTFIYTELKKTNTEVLKHDFVSYVPLDFAENIVKKAYLWEPQKRRATTSNHKKEIIDKHSSHAGNGIKTSSQKYGPEAMQWLYMLNKATGKPITQIVDEIIKKHRDETLRDVGL